MAGAKKKTRKRAAAGGKKTSRSGTRAPIPRRRPPRTQPRSGGRKRPAKEESELSPWTVGAAFLAVAGTGYAIKKHLDAQASDAAAKHASRREEQAYAVAKDVTRRAAEAEERVRKLAMALAADIHHRIAKHWNEHAPPLHFDGCFAAQTDGVVIRIDMTWLLLGIVDPAQEHRAISGRVAGVLAHEWFHFLDTARGSRGLHEEELRADAFAGVLLARLGVSPIHFATLLRDYRQSRTHPAGELRAETMLGAHAREIQKMGVVGLTN